MPDQCWVGAVRMKPLATLVLAALLFAQAPRPAKKKPAPKPPAVEQYDPAKLRPGEIACGRESTGETGPCSCMVHREKISKQVQAECLRIEDKSERAHCMIANEACAIVPITRDSPEYRYDSLMPPQCQRWCTKARCECCKS